MQLSTQDIARYHDEGFLLFPGLLTQDEVGVLRDQLPGLYAGTGPEVVREKTANTIRLVYGAHRTNEAFRRLSLLPRLLNPVRQLLGEETYIHQSRLNPKEGFTGGAWSWHQDFGTWHREDGLPETNCVMTAIFLHDATPVNGPLLVVPRTQRFGLIDTVRPEADAKGYTVMEIDETALTEMADRDGIVPLMGPAGTVAFIHCNLVHGSAGNVSPWPRAIMYLNYNAASNSATQQRRAWHHDNPDKTPLHAIDDGALQDLARHAAE